MLSLIIHFKITAVIKHYLLALGLSTIDYAILGCYCIECERCYIDVVGQFALVSIHALCAISGISKLRNEQLCHI